MELRKLLSLLILGSVYLESQAEILLLSTLDELWTVDTSNGQLTQLGVLPVGGKEIQELAQDPGGGYWAVASNVLYSVDPWTVDAQTVGTLATTGTIAGLAFSSSGTLYGMQWNDRLYTINPDTAQVYYLGQAEVPGPIHTLDIDSQGRLVAPTYNFFDPDDFWEVDPGTLNAVWLEDAPENISAMVFGADDVLFAVSGTSSVLYQVDLDHGTWSELLILDQLGDVEGMELIPETTAAALLAMAIPLVGRRVRRESVDTGAL